MSHFVIFVMQNVKRDITISYSMLMAIYRPISTYFTFSYSTDSPISLRRVVFIFVQR